MFSPSAFATLEHPDTLFSLGKTDLDKSREKLFSVSFTQRKLQVGPLFDPGRNPSLTYQCTIVGTGYGPRNGNLEWDLTEMLQSI